MRGSLAPVFIFYFLVIVGIPALLCLVCSFACYLVWRDARTRKRKTEAPSS